MNVPGPLVKGNKYCFQTTFIATGNDVLALAEHIRKFLNSTSSLVFYVNVQHVQKCHQLWLPNHDIKMKHDTRIQINNSNMLKPAEATNATNTHQGSNIFPVSKNGSWQGWIKAGKKSRGQGCGLLGCFNFRILGSCTAKNILWKSLLPLALYIFDWASHYGQSRKQDKDDVLQSAGFLFTPASTCRT